MTFINRLLTTSLSAEVSALGDQDSADPKSTLLSCSRQTSARHHGRDFPRLLISNPTFLHDRLHERPITNQKDTADHLERVEKRHDTNDVIGFVAESDELPAGYFRSKYFLGSVLATGLGLWASVAQFGYAAPILDIINNDLWPDENYIWISLIYNVCLSVFLPIIGRLSDIFGRRWFFIAGGVLGVVGTIVCATAQSINVLIGAQVITAFANATQLSFHVVLGELVPMKYRYLINAVIYTFCIPGSGLGGLIAYAFVVHHPAVSWRGVYWLLVAINGAALICWFLFYYPPTFDIKHKDQGDASKKIFWIKNYDYGGTILFTAGFVIFLLGLNWGGAVYPWSSGRVIGFIVGGFAILIVFVLYEIYMPLKAPFMPMYLFKNVGWVVACSLLGIGAGVYYAFSIIFPTQSAILYADGDLIELGGLSSLVGAGIVLGQCFGGALCKPIGRQKWQCMAMFVLGGLFLGCAATITVDNESAQIALIFLGCFFIGWNETVCLANATIILHDQQEIGVAGGVAGSIRGAISAVSISVYSTVLNNRLAETVPAQVAPAVTQAGLPADSVADFIAAVGAGTSAAFAPVEGASARIIAIGIAAYQQAAVDAFRTVYFTVIAFAGIGIVLCFFASNTENLMLESVAATLHNEGAHNAAARSDEEKANR